MKRFVGVVVAAGLVVMLAGAMGCAKKQKKTLAVVGGAKITTKDFDQAIKNLPENYKVLAESYKGKHKILDNLIKKQLLVLEAERRGYQKDAELKKKIKETQAKYQTELDQRIESLQQQRTEAGRQVYENLLLNELNDRLKKEGLKGQEVTPQEISTYYADYARKLKILNPAATVPPEEAVSKQVQAILTEEKLIKQLEKQSSVEVKESVFEELYGDKNNAAVIEDTKK